jgi:hypothetical protein
MPVKRSRSWLTIALLLATSALPIALPVTASATSGSSDSNVYVDAAAGNDGNPGTSARPFRTIGKAAAKPSALAPLPSNSKLPSRFNQPKLAPFSFPVRTSGLVGNLTRKLALIPILCLFNRALVLLRRIGRIISLPSCCGAK